MLAVNKIGPWPSIDLASSKITRTSGATWTNIGSDLNVCLDTQNLGSQSEMFVSGAYNVTATATGAQNLSFGGCLQPLSSLSSEPTWLQYSCSVMAYESAASNTNILPFVGFIKTAGASIANGWDATHNLVEDWSSLAINGSTPGVNLTTQILLKDIVSGGLDDDKYVCCGFMIRTYGANGIDDLDYTLSARYMTNAVNTTYRGI